MEKHLTDEQAEELYKLTNFIAKNELDCFWVKCDDGICRPTVNLNDFFAWACADLEIIYASDLPDIEKAKQDIEKACGTDKVLAEIYATDLWAARKNKMRPQNAIYPKANCYADKNTNYEALRKLYDEAGPERPIGMGNPKPRPTQKDDKKAVREHWDKLRKEHPNTYEKF